MSTLATEDTNAVPDASEQAEQLAGRLFNATLESFEILTVYLGIRLGLYEALRAGGSATPAELASRAAIHPRYAREWLEQQAVAGILDVDDPGRPPNERTYTLPSAHAEVILDDTSLFHVGAASKFVASLGTVMPGLFEAYRTGGGLTFGEYGPDVREGQASFNRPAFRNLLTQEWLPAIPDVHERLRADPPARVADVGCGAGWSSIALAQGYPKIRVDAVDSDEASIADARRNLAGTSVSDRVTFEVGDAADLAGSGPYDAAFVFEALHDMSRPVEVLRALRSALAPGGSVIVMDERVAEAFTVPGDEIERFMYSASVLHCLAVGMAEQPSAATGTVLRPDTLRAYVAEAGYSACEVLPIEHDFFRFYRLSG